MVPASPYLMRPTDHELFWQQLLPRLDRDSMPLQLQLRTALVNAILDGRLPVGLRLPSGREVANLVSVSRNTAVLVYDRLVSDGYLDVRPRDGYYVCGSIAAADVRPIEAEGQANRPEWSTRFHREIGVFNWLDRPEGWQRYRYQFVCGQFDRTLFPLADWRECSRQALEVANVERWAQDGTGTTSPELVDHLIRRVLPHRGIAATPNQILLTMGTQHGLYLLAELFGQTDAVIGVENPGYMDARNIFMRSGARVVPLSLDEKGVEISAAMADCQYVYCTPSHQCPTGVTMSTDRRLALLDHAARFDQIIFEDDYDPETQYIGQPLPALKAIDKCDRVIYLSSMSKVLSPGLRLGYIVAPAVVIDQLRILQRLMIRQVPGNNQAAAALFIKLGHYDRLLHATRNILSTRAKALIDALKRYLPTASYSIPQGGSSLWVRLAGNPDMHALRTSCHARGILFDPGDPFFQESMTEPWLRLGFSSIPIDRIAPGIAELAKLVASCTRAYSRI